MDFIVPQFIEREPKIVGPFTFKQFAFVGTAGALTLFLYFFLKDKSFFLFIVVAIFLNGSALALVFLKMGGFPLPLVIKNLFVFLLRPRIYLWKKKFVAPKIFKKKPEEKTEEESPLRVAERSRLRD